MRFIRHCVECPKCLTRYVIGFSPYANGSSLLRIHVGFLEEYILYCSCGSPSACTRWKEGQLAKYSVCKTAHSRGYGSHKEILQQSAATARPPSGNLSPAQGRLGTGTQSR
jgi:hypothetical protein